MRKTEVFFRRLIAVTLTMSALSMLTACGNGGLLGGKLFKERAAETPVPTEDIIDKSFFRDASGEPKRFLCAWAPEIGRGFYGENYLLHLANQSPHCNIEFDITEDYLVGKIINPSYPDHNNPDHRMRWKEALKIPITKHFYYERAKDSHGRETNEWIENTSRSHWSARPKIRLDLAGIKIYDFLSFVGGVTVSSVEDIEWDFANNFLGFSLNVNAPYFDGEFQGRMRLNFLKFEHDKTFVKTPYNQQNSRFMNVLHVMGRKIEGTEPDLYAAHWDLREPHRIYINGAPDQQQKTIINAVYRWNRELNRIGVVPEGKDAWLPIVKEMKHPFDLRYPTINWIQDRRISAHSPLGVGIAHADVENGKILWGGVVLWGGQIERYLNAYAPIESSSQSATAGAFSELNLFSAFKTLLNKMPPAMTAFDGVDRMAATPPSTYTNLLANQATAPMKERLNGIEVPSTADDATRAQIESEKSNLRTQIDNFIQNNPQYPDMSANFSALASSELKNAPAAFHTSMNLDTLFSPEKEEESKSASITGSDAIMNILKMDQLKKRVDALQDLTYGSIPVENGLAAGAFTIEHGLTASSMAGSWMNSAAQAKTSFPDLLDTTVMQLTMHEFGHFLGLGHQFKENILPEQGKVPSRFLKTLAPKATAAAGFTNQTSVMGYPNGRTELEIPTADVHPGPQDDLVMTYLYKGEYATYDKSKDDWQFEKVPVSGVIPLMSDKKNPTAYFPACNDLEASLGADPFCNRWDRGNSAQEIVKSYFENLSDNLLGSLYSLAGGSSNQYAVENGLWGQALDTFSRVRLFYDEMRRRMRSDETLRVQWDNLRQDRSALLQFESICNRTDLDSDEFKKDKNVPESLKNIFADSKMVDLCRANSFALNEYMFYVNLPHSDYVKRDHTTRYVSAGYLEGDAGNADYGHIFGSWYQMSNLPLKLSAMYTLTAGNPYSVYRGLRPNPYFDYAEDRALYRTLYARSYTKLVSDAVLNNLRFEAMGDDATLFGRTILGVGNMLPGQDWTSNDSVRLPSDFNDLLAKQTMFQAGMVAVIIKADTIPGGDGGIQKANYFKRFTATIYDMQSGRGSAASEVYFRPEGKIIVRAPGMFIFPLGPVKFLSSVEAYTFAYKVTFDPGGRDELKDVSVKNRLADKHNLVVDQCMVGFNNNGLKSFFENKDLFAGIYIPPGIEKDTSPESYNKFLGSIDEAYKAYQTEKVLSDIPEGYPKSMTSICDQAVNGVGEITAAAALLNGWWLNITSRYLKDL